MNGNVTLVEEYC